MAIFCYVYFVTHLLICKSVFVEMPMKEYISYLLLATALTLAKPQYSGTSFVSQSQVSNTNQNDCKTEYQTITEVIYDEIEEDICQNTYQTKCDLVPQRKCSPKRQQKCQNIDRWGYITRY